MALALVWGCSSREERRPDVVIIAVDTLRADRLPFHGGPADNAPFLSELAERSVVFENAWSPCSWTLPAAVSVLTSVHPFQHGVSSLEGLELGPDDEPVPVNCIPAQVDTLAESLQAEGYRTFGVVSNILVGKEVGFDRGFDRFVKLDDDDADVVNECVDMWRDEMLDGDTPFFLYLHYFDPHDTFHAREPYFDLAAGTTAKGWPDTLPGEGEDVFADLDWLTTRLKPGPDWLDGRSTAELSRDELRRLLQWMRAAYDSEIAFVDSRIRDVYVRLGLSDAVVFFLADHGEEFYEHGSVTHGQNLHAETVRVPFLLQLPDGERAGRVSSHVTTLDVVPTLRGVLGLPASPQDQGVDLLGELSSRPIYGLLAGKSGQHRSEDDLCSIVLGDHRLITTRDGQAQLFDIAADPGEQVDLARKYPDIVSRLQQELERVERSAPVFPRTTRIPEPPSAAMLEHLQGIGYLGDE